MNKKLERLNLYYLAIISFLLGIVILVISTYVPDARPKLQFILESMGGSLIVASIVAGIVEEYLKRRLYDQIKTMIKNFQRDAITAYLIGENIPKPISSNIQETIANCAFYREDYKVEYDISNESIYIKGINYTKCKVTTEYKIINLRDRITEYPLKSELDQFSEELKNNTKFHLVSITGVEPEVNLNTQPQIDQYTESRGTICRFKKKIDLFPKNDNKIAQVKIISDGYIKLEEEDSIHIHCLYPTINSTIKIINNSSKKLDILGSPLHPADPEGKDFISYFKDLEYSWTLKCGILPFQGIIVYTSPHTD